MIRKLAFLVFLALAFGPAKSQTVQELYESRNFEALIKHADKTDELGKFELYCIGYAFFQLGDDKKAIELYDKAIAQGLDDDYIYLYKGLALMYDDQDTKAIHNFRLAIIRNPQGQKNYTELANAFYYQKKYDSALVYFYEARALDYELGDPYLMVPLIFHTQENFEKALEEYQISASLIDKNDPQYIELLKSIGQLEYGVFHRYDNAIKAYSEMVNLAPKDYDLYSKLIKAYYANENYDKGDSLFNIMKVEYHRGTLSEELQKFGSVAIDQFEWKGQMVSTFRYFTDPENALDIIYKIYLLSKDGKSVERTLMTEKTIQIGEDGPKHLLCERKKNGIHHTYSHGWSSDEIDYVSLKKSVLLVLDGELRPAASSNFGVKSKKKTR